MQEEISLSSLMSQEAMACADGDDKCEVEETENENIECDPETGECWYVEKP